ncbi:MAG: hypothetical protein ACJ8M1_12570 [Chthoniobacterales bacterium]
MIRIALLEAFDTTARLPFFVISAEVEKSPALNPLLASLAKLLVERCDLTPMAATANVKRNN